MMGFTATCVRTRDQSHGGRIVVKVGSAFIAGDGNLSSVVVGHLATEVGTLRRSGFQVVLVVSGAVAAGYSSLGLTTPPAEVVPRQATASIGQPRLMAAFADAFARIPLATAQLLLSAADIENRRRFLSARHTIILLLRQGIVPIINENDALSDDEVKVGDNDHLTTLVTQLASADLLVMLSTVDGVLTRKGHGPRLTKIQPGEDVSAHLDESRSNTGIGGMHAKVSAARLVVESGIPAIIADGRLPGVLAQIGEGRDVGTFFAPRQTHLSARRQWIAVRSRSRGTLHVDAGAVEAICTRGASLLPVGVVRVTGNFAMGCRVDIIAPTGARIGMGLVNYSAREIHNMCGRQAADFLQVLGYRYVDEIIERDDLVLSDRRSEEST